MNNVVCDSDCCMNNLLFKCIMTYTVSITNFDRLKNYVDVCKKVNKILSSNLKVMYLTLFIFIFIIFFSKGCLSLRLSLGPSLHALAHKHDVSSILFMKKVSIGNYGVTHHSHYPNTWHEVRLCFDPWYTP